MRSPTRAAAVRAWLREETGLAEERLAALRAPAGIDLGAETAEEVALSILAELVQVRRGRAQFVASPGPATLAGDAEMAALATAAGEGLALVDDDIVTTDPVCGMEVDPAHARHLAEHEDDQDHEETEDGRDLENGAEPRDPAPTPAPAPPSYPSPRRHGS